MSLYSQAREQVLPTPKNVKKLMRSSYDPYTKKAEVLGLNPGSYVISWYEILRCCWTYMKMHYETRGIFPPSFMVDHKNAPETDTFRTNAELNIAWTTLRARDGTPRQIFPSYVEVRVYMKNTMRSVYENFGHTLPEPAMIAYMCNVAIHEFRHYLKYYDYSYNYDTAMKSDEDGSDVEFKRALIEMDDFVDHKDMIKNEYETEHGSILDTLNYMQHNFLSGDIGIACNEIKPIPGGPYDLFLREKYKDNAAYRMASLMCEYLWVCLREDFGENLSDDDYKDLRRRKKKIAHEFYKYSQKHPTKMLIID